MKNVELKKKFEEKYEKVMHELDPDLELKITETDEGCMAYYSGKEYGGRAIILEKDLEKDIDEVVDFMKMQYTNTINLI